MVFLHWARFPLFGNFWLVMFLDFRKFCVEIEIENENVATWGKLRQTCLFYATERQIWWSPSFPYVFHWCKQRRSWGFELREFFCVVFWLNEEKKVQEKSVAGQIDFLTGKKVAGVHSFFGLHQKTAGGASKHFREGGVVTPPSVRRHWCKPCCRCATLLIAVRY